MATIYFFEKNNTIMRWCQRREIKKIVNKDKIFVSDFDNDAQIIDELLEYLKNKKIEYKIYIDENYKFD